MSNFCCCSSHHAEAAPPIDLNGNEAPSDSQARPLPNNQTPCNELPYQLAEHEEHQSSLSGRAGAAFTAVKRGLTRHLSSERVAKRHSSITIGSSQEEVARRAELRRLRDKRIQEELSNDPTSDRASDAPSKRARHISSLTNLSFRGGGPRDTIEFVVQPPERLEEEEVPDSRKSEDTVKQAVQRHELHESGSSLHEAPNRDAETIDAKAVQKLPASESHSSLTDQFDRHSAHGIWLAAQILRSQDSSIVRLDDTVIENSTKPDLAKASGPEGRNREDKTTEWSHSQQPEESSPREHTDERQNTSMLPYSPSPSMRSQERQTARSFDAQPQDQQKLRQSPSDDLVESYAAAMAFTNKTDNASSHYTSRIPSFEPSPAQSYPNLRRMRPEELAEPQSSPYEHHENGSTLHRQERSDDRSSYETAHDDSSFQVTANKQPSETMEEESSVPDVPPVSPSETSSFFQREAELATVEKRFGDRLSSRKSPVPVRSRFKEEFGPSTKGEKKNTSLVPKIFVSRPVKQMKGLDNPAHASTKRAAPRSPIVGECYDQYLRPDRLAPPSIGLGINDWSSEGFNPGLEESATGMWQRAIKLEAEQRKTSSRSASLRSMMRSSDRSKNPSGSRSPATSTGTQIHHTPVRSKVNLQAPPPWPMPSAKKTSPMPTQMDPAGIFGFPKLPPRFAMPPASWARYPSHSRSERSGHATGKDGVYPKDFAIRTASSDDHLHWTTNKPDKMKSLSPRSVSLYARLEKVLKAGQLRLVPLKDRSGNSRSKSNVLGRRRASSHLGGEVEYPELEVLPPDIGHLLEPEQVAERLAERKPGSRTSVHSIASTSRRGDEDPVTSAIHMADGPSQESRVKNEAPRPESKHIQNRALDGAVGGRQAFNLPSARSEQVLSSPWPSPRKSWPRSISWNGLGLKPNTADSPGQRPGHEIHNLERGPQNDGRDSIELGTTSLATALGSTARPE